MPGIYVDVDNERISVYKNGILLEKDEAITTLSGLCGKGDSEGDALLSDFISRMKMS